MLQTIIEQVEDLIAKVKEGIDEDEKKIAKADANPSRWPDPGGVRDRKSD